MIEGLFREGLIVVKGPPGAGKTLLVARAVSSFSRSVWFTFYETEERLRRYLSTAGIRPPTHIFDFISLGRDVQRAVEIIGRKVEEVDPDVVVVDGVNALGGGRELAHAVFYHGISRERPVILIKEGTDTDPLDYIADTVIRLSYAVAGGAMRRRLTILKARGRSNVTYTYPLVLSEEGPVVVEYPGAQPQVPAGRLTTGSPEVDQALGGGILRGSLVAVVGPEDGLASKMMVLTAVELARRGARVLYHHHKRYPTFLSFAESLGVRWRRDNIEWFYHPVEEHMTVEWWYRSARLVNRLGADVHFADQYELVASMAGLRLLAEAFNVYTATLTRPVTTVLIFNSPTVWREVSERLGSLADYVFTFQANRLTAVTPHSPTPISFTFKLNREARRVEFTPE